jgi:hypothetical protein
MSLSSEEKKSIQAKVLAKAWTDSGYKKQLLTNPKEVLESEGLEIPSELVILEDTKDKKHIVLPMMPEGIAEMSIEDIQTRVAMLLEVQIEMF